ncbi:MAG TPA: ATP-grasp domain-containing protein [Solirubrobacter sp.]|nr:ATP-grasp domain-containing protein [Solirubrobacter sp.]
METHRSIVIVPSRTIDKFHEPAAETQAYEERLLCLLLMLRDPDLRVIYVTSSPVAEPIVDYYLSLLAGVPDARERLTMLAAGDASVRPLSAKLLERPALLEEIASRIPDRARCHLVPYVSTELEHAVGDALGIPVHGADPELADLGTKSGSRELFARAGVAHPLGSERITGRADAVAAIVRLRAERPDLAEVVVKLDAGVSGEGNALVDLTGLPRPGARGEKRRIGERFDALALEADVPLELYLERLSAGGVVEERITGDELRSPSVQLELTPGGEARIVSTHDQILSGQRYLGCRFPAEPAYAGAITASARRVGALLAQAGARGRAGIDFVVARDDGGAWHAYAIEVNLRSGGTTHPLTALELLSGGVYDADTAIFTTPCGAARHYVATDHLESPRLRELGHRGLLALQALPRLAADGCGVVFHMLSALDELGRVGLTAIGYTAADAQSRFEHAQALLLEPDQAVLTL